MALWVRYKRPCPAERTLTQGLEDLCHSLVLEQNRILQTWWQPGFSAVLSPCWGKLGPMPRLPAAPRRCPSLLPPRRRYLLLAKDCFQCSEGRLHLPVIEMHNHIDWVVSVLQFSPGWYGCMVYHGLSCHHAKYLWTILSTVALVTLWANNLAKLAVDALLGVIHRILHNSKFSRISVLGSNWK